MLNARIRCLVFAVLWFAFFNVRYFSIVIIRKDVCLLPVSLCVGTTHIHSSVICECVYAHTHA